MHGQTLETIWSTRRFQLIDSNHHFDLFYWIFIRRSFGSPGSPYWTVGMPGTFKNRYAWCKLEKKTTEPHSQSRALGLRKMEPSLLWNGKNAFAAHLRTCFGTKILIFVGQTIYCSMPRWGKARSGSRFACMLCSLSWLSVLHGSRACEGGPKPADI